MTYGRIVVKLGSPVTNIMQGGLTMETKQKTIGTGLIVAVGVLIISVAQLIRMSPDVNTGLIQVLLIGQLVVVMLVALLLLLIIKKQ